jgi:glycosyltransferase involved in cell wall biosynthesis
MYPPNFIGGAELIAHYQAKALTRLGQDVIIFAGEPGDGGKRHQMVKDEYDGLTVYRVRPSPYEDYSKDFINFHHRDVDARFQKILDEFSPDVVHFHNIIGLSLGMIHLARKKGARTVLTVHDHWGFCHKNTVMKEEQEICGDFTRCAECMPFINDGGEKHVPVRMRQDYLSLLLGEVDAFISPSEYLAGQYQAAGIGEGRFSVVWNGIDVQRFGQIKRTPNNHCVRFTFVGYFGKHKGVHTLLEALPHLSDKSRVQINLVGDGEQLQQYRSMVKASGYEDSVKFWGKVDNRRIEEVYQDTDVLVLPSIWPENQPVSITEAMAARIPVIASRMGGIPELVIEGRTGFLFEAGNAKDLARKMSEFVADPDKMTTLGERAHHAMTKNSFDTQVGKLLRIYEDAHSAQTQSRNEHLVVCIGNQMDPECARAMHTLTSAQERHCFRFIMSDWLEEDQIKEAVMLWIVDSKIH